MAQSRRKFMQALVATGAVGVGATGVAEAAETGTSEGGKTYIPPESVLLYECTRKEIRDRINSGALKAAVIPVGATEQHNEHLAMIMDTAASLFVSQHAALALFPQVIVTTPLPIGISPYWMKRQGTLTLSTETFIGYITDICKSLKVHGITRVLVVNGHGGNMVPLAKALPEMRQKLGITLDAFSYWETLPRKETLALMKSGDYPGHASEFETSFALAAFPQRVRRVEFVGDDPAAWEPDPRNLEQVGWYRAEFDVPSYDKTTYAESLLATREKGIKCIAMAIEGVRKRIEKLLLT